MKKHMKEHMKEQPVIFVLIGAHSALAKNKLWPTLIQLFDQSSGKTQYIKKIIAVGRRQQHQADFLSWFDQQMLQKNISASIARRLHHCTEYCQIDLKKSDDYTVLHQYFDDQTAAIFYLSTHSDLYVKTVEQLQQHKLLNKKSKVVFEKPIGSDLNSAKECCQRTSSILSEQQSYLIDHYLGKDTVQNLLALRFANTLFEYQWNQKYIDHVQITIAETIGIEGRADFYDKTGALRDVLQSHLLQLLCLIAMEPPSSLHSEAIRDEKVKVLYALKSLNKKDIVTGQYTAGQSDHQSVNAYLQEPGIPQNSCTETFVALRVQIDNWRWSGVPFYLRTGKRLPEQRCEIVVTFKDVPHSLYRTIYAPSANKLFLRLQPDAGIDLLLVEKAAGQSNQLEPALLRLNQLRQSSIQNGTSYQRLFEDMILGNQSLFVREDEMLAAWHWLEPLLSSLKERPALYPAGTWGPATADELIAKDQRAWELAV